MSNEVKFDEEDNYNQSFNREVQQTLGSLEKLVIKTGIVKDVTGAKYVLIGIIFFCIIVVIIVLTQYFGTTPLKVPPEVIEEMKRSIQ